MPIPRMPPGGGRGTNVGCLVPLVIVGLACLSLAASCPPKPPDPEPCKPVPAAEPKFTWESPTTLELTWVDMPVTVGGGDEKCVLNRRLAFSFDKPVEILTVYSFQAVDSGDSIEMLTALYAKDGEPLYKRSEHITPGVCTEYDAFDPPQPVNYETDGLILDAVCRVTGNNKDTGELNARCHLAVYVKVADAPPPPEGCDTEEADLIADTCSKGEYRDEVKAATAALGSYCGHTFRESLDALTGELRRQNPGMCAISGIEAIFIERSDLRHDEYHAVASVTGCWTDSGFGKWIGCHSKKGAPPGECGEPNPLGLPAEFVVKKHNKWLDRTYRVRSWNYCQEACDAFIGRASCPVRCEGDPEREPCEERVIGEGKWWCDGQLLTEPCSTSSAPCLKDGNPSQAKCFSHWKTCTDDGVTCSEGDW